MDPFFEAVSLFRRRNYDKCIERCTKILEKNPFDQPAWVLKMRALTQRVYIDDIDAEDGGLPDSDLDDVAVASAPRPGTSLRTPLATAATGRGTATARPRTSTGRPVTGVSRPGTMSRPGTSLGQALRSARVPTGSARAVRLGTASMLSLKDGPFIQVSRLNLGKYADNPCIAKPLFQYLYYHEGDTRKALDLCAQATQRSNFNDWWWKVQLARCYLVLRLHRDAEQQLRSAWKQRPHVESALLMARVYTKIDQPLSAMEVCRVALEEFPNEVSIMTEQARLMEGLDNLQASVRMYRQIAVEDAMNTEALACIAVHHFYNDQPEIALRYYRRILSMGAFSSELFNNLALCCLYSQQLDLTLACFQRALQLATSHEQRGEVWYNLSFVAVSAGDLGLARRCLRLCISSDSSHGAALNNLAVLEVVEQWNTPRGPSRPAVGRAKAYMAGAMANTMDSPEVVHNATIFNMV